MSRSEEKAKEYANTIVKIANIGVKQAIREYSIIENAYQKGYAQATTDLSTENAQLKEALRELVKEIETNKINWLFKEANMYRCLISPENLDKAKQLLNKE